MSDCADVKKRFNLIDSSCCDSCHEDAEEGVDDLFQYEHGDEVFEVCCYVADDLDEHFLDGEPWRSWEEE